MKYSSTWIGVLAILAPLTLIRLLPFGFYTGAILILIISLAIPLYEKVRLGFVVFGYFLGCFLYIFVSPVFSNSKEIVDAFIVWYFNAMIAVPITLFGLLLLGIRVVVKKIRNKQNPQDSPDGSQITTLGSKTKP